MQSTGMHGDSTRPGGGRCFQLQTREILRKPTLPHDANVCDVSFLAPSPSSHHTLCRAGYSTKKTNPQSRTWRRTAAAAAATSPLLLMWPPPMPGCRVPRRGRRGARATSLRRRTAVPCSAWRGWVRGGRQGGSLRRPGEAAGEGRGKCQTAAHCSAWSGRGGGLRGNGRGLCSGLIGI